MKNFKMINRGNETTFELDNKTVATFINDLDGHMSRMLFLKGLVTNPVVTVYDTDKRQFIIGDVGQLDADQIYESEPMEWHS